MNPWNAGLALGALLGGVHLLWAAAVAFGLAQPFLDFIFWAHFIRPTYVVAPFEAGQAAMLVVVTTAIGAALGCAFGLLWSGLGDRD